MDRASYDNHNLSGSKEEQYSNMQDDSAYRAQLLESKMLRKKAEEDAQLLANRIALLQMEEKKAMKKIDETKKKAHEIVVLKERNLQKEKEKEKVRKQKEQEELKKAMQNKNIKQQTRINQEINRNHLIRKAQDDAHQIKKAKQDIKDIAYLSKHEDYQKNVQMVDQIRNREREQQLRRRQQEEEKKQKARLEYQKKIENENVQKAQTDDLIARLEQQEMELIQRLQKTQGLQKEAFDDLEKALSMNQ